MITKPEGSKLLNEGGVAAYGLTEAARYLRIAPATLRSWVAGRSYATSEGRAFFEPPITLPDPSRTVLSFENLIEAHVLWALRVEHGVSLRDVRTALAYAEEKLGIDRLLLREELKTSGDIFLDHYGELVNLSRSGQLAMKKVLDTHLKRIDWGELDRPVRLYPISGNMALDHDRVISIDPRIGFGRPVIHETGVTTEAIVSRIDAGEEPGDVAADYDISIDQVEAAIVFEKAA